MKAVYEASNMTIGGFKFKGYQYNRPDDFDASDDTQDKAQLLEMFRCRIKAFLGSCELSGAQWEPNLSAGHYSYSNLGNIIYDLEYDKATAGYNFAAFFKYKDRDSYFALVSENNPATSSGAGHWYTTNQYDRCSDTISIGNVQITPSNIKSNAVGKTLLRGAEPNSSSSGAYMSTRTAQLKIKYGFATKDEHIIIINGSSYALIASNNAFTSLFGPSDNYHQLVYWCSCGTSTSTTSMDICGVTPIVLDSRGYTHISSNIIAHNNRAGYYTSAQISIPFASIMVSQSQTIIATLGESVNKDGITSKGYINAELLSTNGKADNVSWPIPLCTYANGNYLCIKVFQDYSYYGCGGAVYCGWDPSNPDINNANEAFEAYTSDSLN